MNISFGKVLSAVLPACSLIFGASIADARTQPAGLGVLYADPAGCLTFSNATVQNTCADGAATIPG